MSEHFDEDSDTSIFVYPRSDVPRLDASDELAILGAELAEQALSAFKNGSAPDVQPHDASLGLACPFFAHDPSTHKRCLRSNLQRIIDVKRHVWAYHKRPHDCPICHSIFDTRTDWDRHVRADLCTAAPPDPQLAITSVTRGQLELLARPSESGRPKEDQWFVIWAVVFPGLDWPSIGPVLSSEVEIVREIGRLRSFWHANGQRATAEFLVRKGTSGEESRGLRRLSIIALDRMIDRHVADFV
ncbi:hypothetical protein B0T16DRAFT_188373 [Cercophora newfieldiana]|uniref:C2H2-type domain-containing protein n=1 Tax=Cercophora newfieldiana TaxID=92897 RepID=A0AA40CMA1_9PEZI|nr:hypothetical protein B0T16DRAFT_188373 [Cercophora newfieldiana]